jgi:Rrf2 family protein
MRFSQGVEWGLHCVLLLARMPAGEMVSRRSLAQHYDLPEMYLAKNLQALTRSGILQATPGPRGGFQLARDPDEITVLDVVEAIEGAAPPFICQEIRQRVKDPLPAAAYRTPCRIKTVMFEAHEAWRSSLRQVTIEDIARDLPADVRP